MKTALLLALLILSDTLSDVSLAKGMKQIGALSTLHFGPFEQASRICRGPAQHHDLIRKIDMRSSRKV